MVFKVPSNPDISVILISHALLQIRVVSLKVPKTSLFFLHLKE